MFYVDNIMKERIILTPLRGLWKILYFCTSFFKFTNEIYTNVIRVKSLDGLCLILQIKCYGNALKFFKYGF